MKKHIFISGRVQGVGFRHFTKKNAEALGVKGWVKNLPDKRVEAIFQGSEEKVDDLIQRCKKGPVASFVQDIKVRDAKDETVYKSFEVKL
ncbi:MAG: acylphosphatase [Gracilimonas sp.]|uniref:acylphosphatase n=1 Tax=Gracilimonas sp. TaxID=1974203 RepID=UPI0019945C0E|nr:acylphosphatase [Gracilimonas sp.]MBD3615271.1 acylphosphatase [Gracilimonas sp.]